MEYSEDNVALAYARHPDIHPHQHAVWKTRGSIPDRYFDDTKTIRKRVQGITKLEGLKQDRLQLVLKSEKINATKVWAAAGLPQDRYMVLDFLQSRMMLNDAERLKLTVEVQRLRASIRNTIAMGPGLSRRKALVKLGQDVRLKKKPTFGETIGALLAPTRPVSSDIFSNEQLQTMEDQLALLMVESSL